MPATLVTLSEPGLVASILPMVFHPSEGANGTLRGHLARGNPQWRDLRSDVDALALFQGPDSYITPGFYETKRLTGKDVPTWNYTTVQVRGPLTLHHEPSGCWHTCGRWSTGRRRAAPNHGRSTTRPPATSRPRRRPSLVWRWTSAHRCQAQAQPEPYRRRLPGRHRGPVGGFAARAGGRRRDAQGVSEVLMHEGDPDDRCRVQAAPGPAPRRRAPGPDAKHLCVGKGALPMEPGQIELLLEASDRRRAGGCGKRHGLPGARQEDTGGAAPGALRAVPPASRPDRHLGPGRPRGALCRRWLSRRQVSRTAIRAARSGAWPERRTAIVATYFFIRQGDVRDTFGSPMCSPMTRRTWSRKRSAAGSAKPASAIPEPAGVPRPACTDDAPHRAPVRRRAPRPGDPHALHGASFAQPRRIAEHASSRPGHRCDGPAAEPAPSAGRRRWWRP